MSTNCYWYCPPRALFVIQVLHSLVLLHTQVISCLFCPTPSALRLVLKLCDCDDFACEYDAVFNADKSKLMICRSSKQFTVVRDVKGCSFHIGGRDIELVDSFSHLGHIGFCDTKDTRYRGRRNRYVGQVNNCLCFFLSNWNVMWDSNCLIPIAVFANFGHLVISLLKSLHMHGGRCSTCFVLTL